jgi:signal peptidase
MKMGKKIFKIISIVIKTIIGVALAAFILVVCMQRFSDNKLSLFNFRLFSVVSQSMVPVYDIGDVLVAKEQDPSTIKEGDIVSYLGTTGSFANKVVTHRVVNVEKREDGKYYYRTKGDANLVEDPIVMEDQLYGVVVHKSVLLSLVYRIVGTQIGFFMFIIIPIMFVIGSEMISTLLEKEEDRRKKMSNKTKE